MRAGVFGGLLDKSFDKGGMDFSRPLPRRSSRSSFWRASGCCRNALDGIRKTQGKGMDDQLWARPFLRAEPLSPTATLPMRR